MTRRTMTSVAIRTTLVAAGLAAFLLAPLPLVRSAKAVTITGHQIEDGTYFDNGAGALNVGNATPGVAILTLQNFSMTSTIAGVNVGNWQAGNYHGTINIESGSTLTTAVSTTRSILGNATGNSTLTTGTVRVNGLNSHWNAGGPIAVGYGLNANALSSGELIIEEGGTITSPFVNLAYGVSTTGIATVTGSGSKLTLSKTVQDGGLTVSGLRNTSGVYTAGGTALLNVSDGGIVEIAHATSGMMIGPNGRFAGAGGKIQRMTEPSTNNVLVTNQGTVAPGIGALKNGAGATGVLTIEGDYTQAATGKLQIELASASQFDQLVVRNAATLQSGGTLEVSLVNGFVLNPNVSYSFDVLDIGPSGTLTGAFAGLANNGDVVGNFNGVDLFINYGDGGVSLYTVAIPEPATASLALPLFLACWACRRKR